MRVAVLVVLDPENNVLSTRAFKDHMHAIEEFEKATKKASETHLVQVQMCDVEEKK